MAKTQRRKYRGGFLGFGEKPNTGGTTPDNSKPGFFDNIKNSVSSLSSLFKKKESTTPQPVQQGGSRKKRRTRKTRKH